MTLIITLIIISLSINIFLILSPLSIGITILFIALIVATLFSYAISSWIAFLIFLIYIGGMLVIFSYFVSLTPNQTINIIYILVIMTITLITLGVLTSLLSLKTTPITTYVIQSNIFYLKPNSTLLILLATILLITIIIVVKLTITNKGPLRPFNK
jgi:NADH-ubiquinone oxidoreductase chain 6